MTTETISVEDRLAIYDRLGRYVWALDTGDVAGVEACFTPDARMTDTQGNVYDGPGGARRFASEFVTRPEFRGRQHLVTHLFVEGGDEQYIVTSYWTVVQWLTKAGEKAVVSIGWSKDTCVRTTSGWLISERWLGWFSDAHGPWVGPERPTQS